MAGKLRTITRAWLLLAMLSMTAGAADVIVVYLLPKQLEKLLPQLQKLGPGARIVSHQFAIPGVAPDDVQEVESLDDGEMHKLFLWTTPLNRRDK